MAKWADFVITRVRYNSSNTRIIKVVRRKDLGEKLDKPLVKTRKAIVTAIGNKISYVTGFKENGEWVKGDKVIRYLLDGEYFIRTDGNKKKADNLGKLPKF